MIEQLLQHGPTFILKRKHRFALVAAWMQYKDASVPIWQYVSFKAGENDERDLNEVVPARKHQHFTVSPKSPSPSRVFLMRLCAEDPAGFPQVP